MAVPPHFSNYNTRQPPENHHAQLYQSLDSRSREIRVLDVYPGTSEEPLDCILRSVLLTDNPAPRYEAISYTWGTNEAREAININGVEVHVPANTAVVLRRCRQATEVRTVWVDAICINQQDIHERSSQVALMATIYRTSESVVVWLGHEEATPTISSDIDAIIDWAMTSLHMDTYETLVESISSYRGSHELTKAVPDELLTSYAELYTLAHQPWFTRRWVVHEVALARHTTCYWGLLTISLERALMAARIIARTDLTLEQWRTVHTRSRYRSVTRRQNGIYLIARMWQALHLPEARSPGALLSVILEHLQDMAGSEPRDLVYATLGLWQSYSGIEDLPPPLRSDYSKPLGRVFGDAQKYILRSDACVNMLQDLRLNEPWPAHEQGASWVKRWGTWYADAPALLPTCHIASGKRLYEAVEAEPDGELWLRGVEIDSISDSVAPVSPELLSTINGQAAFVGGVVASLHVQVDQDEDVKALAHTLATGVTWYGQTLAAMRLLNDAEIEDAVDFVACPPAGIIVPTRAQLDSELSAAARYAYGLKRGCAHRSVFRTEAGHFGLGPAKLVRDDVVAVVHGCSFPLLLRPYRHGYQLLGCCYLHGFMEGEAMEHCRSGALSENVLVLM